MKRFILITALAAAGVLALAGTGLADDHFDKCDKSGDGKLSLDEFRGCHPDPAKAEKDFKWYDRDKNGVVTRDEYKGHVKPK